jgi:hypothetical protein
LQRGPRVHDRFDVGRLSTGLDPREMRGLDALRRADAIGVAPVAAPVTIAPAQGEPAPAVVPSQVDSAPVAVITESAEPVYINERHDTTEAPPLVRELLERELTVKTAAPSAAPVHERPTEPTVPLNGRDAATVKMNALEIANLTADARAADEPPAHDKVAQQRGFVPLRVRARTAAVRATSSQRIVLTSAIVAVVSIAIATAAIVWACSAVADAEQARRAAEQQIPAATVPAQAQAPVPAPMPGPAPTAR